MKILENLPLKKIGIGAGIIIIIGVAWFFLDDKTKDNLNQFTVCQCGQCVLGNAISKGMIDDTEYICQSN